MKTRHLFLCIGVIGCMATTAGAMAPQQPVVPSEKFKVVVEKEPKNSITKNNFKFHYAFCYTDKNHTQALDSGASPIKYMDSRNSGQFRNGFSTLIKSTQANSQPDMNGYVRLLVTTISDAKEAKKVLRAKLANNGLAPEQHAQIFISEPAVRRNPEPNKISSCASPKEGSSVDGKVTFKVTQTVFHAADGSSDVKIEVVDQRSCKAPKVKKSTKSASERLKSAKEKAKTSAKKAWSSTKDAASKAKQKVSSAASSAKESITKRFGSGSK